MSHLHCAFVTERLKKTCLDMVIQLKAKIEKSCDPGFVFN